MNIWDILKISPTSDQKAIRRAYAEQLRHNNPEENPEGFQSLRVAYERALNEAPVPSHTITSQETPAPQVEKLHFKTPVLEPKQVPEVNAKQIKALVMVDNLLEDSDSHLLKQWRLEGVFKDLEFSLLFQEALLDGFITETYFPKKLFLRAYKIFDWKQLRLKIKDNPLSEPLDVIIENEDLHDLLHSFENHQKSPLFQAALLDDLELAKEALTTDPDSIKRHNEKQDTPLHVACQEGAIEVATYLVEQGAPLEATNDLGKTPLLVAIEHEELECIQMLTAAGANVNHRDKSRYTPLYLAVATCCIAIILIFALHRRIEFDSDALCFAVRSNELEIVKILVEAGADPSARSSRNGNDTPLQCAARYDHLEILSYLLEKGADPNPISDHPESSPLSITAKRGFEKAFKLLLEAGGDPHCKYGEPFLLAMQQGHHNILKFFDLEGVISPYVVIRLSQAGFYGFPSVTDDLCFRYESFYDVDENNQYVYTNNKYALNIRPINDTTNPLFQAVLRNDRTALQQLLEAGHNPNQTLDNGLGLLHVAIQHHFNDLFDLLLEQGADINLAPGPWPKLAYSPLFAAVKFKNSYAYEILTERGALDVPTGSFHTALYPAVYNGDLSLVKDLIARGSNINQYFWTGYRNLVYAAVRYQQIDILKYLLSLGLHPDMYPQQTPPENNSTGALLTPLTVAVKNHDLEAVQLLLAAGANPNRPSEGVPPLHFAISQARFNGSKTRDFEAVLASYHAIIDALLAAGADINATSDSGETFLIKAIQNEEKETALHLIKAGADVNVRDKKGLYPVDHALANNQHKVLLTLIYAGANCAANEASKEAIMTLYNSLTGR